jgi:hypothetical protein
MIHEFTEHDRNSSLFVKIRQNMEERKALHMEKNNHSMSLEATEKLRGRIAECDFILSLGKPLPETESVDPDTEY